MNGAVNGQEPLPYRCHSCGRRFSTVSKLRVHAVVDERRAASAEERRGSRQMALPPPDPQGGTYVTRPQAVEPFDDQAPPELRLAEALRDPIGGLVAELPSPAPGLSEVRALPAVEEVPESRMYVQLTDRERDVLAHMARGLDTAEIGAQLYLAVRTVKSYVAMVLAKLNAANRAHAVAIALRMGFITPTLDELLGMDTTDKEGETQL